MSAKGAKYMWREGKILHASRLWKAPTKRRIPRIHIEARALEVGILMHLEEPWMIFEETKEKAEEIDQKNARELRFYMNRYHLLPEKFENEDTYDWLKKPGNAFLLWGVGSHYFVKPLKR